MTNGVEKRAALCLGVWYDFLYTCLMMASPKKQSQYREAHTCEKESQARKQGDPKVEINIPVQRE